MNKGVAKSKKDDILDVVLLYITEKGAHDITIREIARLAHANSAAISYYFGSKENLIHEACKRYYEIAGEIFLGLSNNSINPRERLKRVCIQYTEYMIKYIGFLKVEFSQYINESNARTDMEFWLETQASLISEAIGQATHVTDREVLSMKTMQLISSIVYPSFLIKYKSSIGIIDYTSKEKREKYINLLIDNILGIEIKESAPTNVKKLWIE
jgi:AcrR family transcriptional regulator